MKILIRAVRISQRSSPHHQTIQDVLIEHGHISRIGKLKLSADLTIDAKGMILSPGWFDLGTFVGEPGLEHKEDLTSATQAATWGGFSEIATLPNTKPCVQSKSQVKYLMQGNPQRLVQVHALAAATVDAQGEKLTEMIDLHQAGAVGFTDGLNSLWNTDILLKSLQYLQSFEGVLINSPADRWLTRYGQMNEGIYSVQLGLRGMPKIAEEIIAHRDIEILRYAGGKLHLTSISSPGTVDLIRRAKKDGLSLSCDIASYQALLHDENLKEFDTNYKVNPPLRDRNDIKMLVKAIQDDTIDILKSGHLPQDLESKATPFDQADFGMINLQTFAAQLTQLAQWIDMDALIHKVSVAPRVLLGQVVPSISTGARANLTLFDPKAEWVFGSSRNGSKSANSPWLGKRIEGLAKAVFNNGMYFIHE